MMLTLRRLLQQIHTVVDEAAAKNQPVEYYVNHYYHDLHKPAHDDHSKDHGSVHPSEEEQLGKVQHAAQE
jgi:hypothetical protein